MLKALAAYLRTKGIETTKSHTSGGDPILETANELGLALYVEINDQKDGSHETVPLEELVERLTDWRND